MIEKLQRIILILFASIFIIIILNLGMEINKNLYYQHEGYYNFGFITIRAANIDDLEEYTFIAMHEWGHKIMDKEFTKEDMIKWERAIKECGMESEYARSYKSAKLQIMEEWADDFAIYIMTNQSNCPEKEELYQKYK